MASRVSITRLRIKLQLRRVGENRVEGARHIDLEHDVWPGRSTEQIHPAIEKLATSIGWGTEACRCE
jgi:hypothetical protein